MRTAFLTLAMILALGAMFAACGSSDSSGPKCEVVKTCNPACALPKLCNPTTLACVDVKTCTPACKTDGTEVCDPFAGTCKAVPKTCTPACKTDGTEYCDNGNCKKLPVCTPACKTGEVCMS